MMKIKKTAFSLIEFLFVVTIFIIAAVIAIQMFTTLNKDYKVLTGYLKSYLKGREIIDVISKDCRIGVRVMDSYGAYTTTDSCLVLKVPSIDASRNIIDVNNKFDYIIYRMVGGDLWKTVIPGSGSSRPVYNDVFKKSIESVYIVCAGIPLSSVPHKSSITHLT
ncbi:MAG: hypothetical protein KAU58_02235, partial [Candidatus Omnitrophica bacterium]|nr:hypothetical protein [Candidatus Omnitrophota bacterium]